MKKPTPKHRPKGIRRYDGGGSVSDRGPVSTSGISSGVQSGMSTALRLMQMKNISGGGSGGGSKPGGGGGGGGGGGSDNTSTPDTGSAPPSTPSSAAMGAQMDWGVPGGRKGGVIKRVAGKPVGKDDGLIAAQRGEYVVKKSAVKKLGTKALNTINKGRLPQRKGR